MSQTVLNNKSLEKFVNDLDLTPENKAKILEKIPTLDEEERTDLFMALTKIYFLEQGKEREKKEISVWQKFIADPTEDNLKALEKAEKEPE